MTGWCTFPMENIVFTPTVRMLFCLLNTWTADSEYSLKQNGFNLVTYHTIIIVLFISVDHDGTSKSTFDLSFVVSRNELCTSNQVSRDLRRHDPMWRHCYCRNNWVYVSCIFLLPAWKLLNIRFLYFPNYHIGLAQYSESTMRILVKRKRCQLRQSNKEEILADDVECFTSHMVLL